MYRLSVGKYTEGADHFRRPGLIMGGGLIITGDRSVLILGGALVYPGDSSVCQEQS